ncbi:ubiquitin-like small modifier protein 1 [Candidatus Alkanophaga liquidiphilum]
MRIKIRLFAMFRELVGAKEMELHLEERSSIFDALSKLREMYGICNELFNEHGKLRDHVRVLRNGRGEELRSMLKDGDEIAIFPPAVGG